MNIDSNSREGLQQLLNEHGSIRAVSRATGIPKSTLQDRMFKYGLKSPYIKGNVVFNNLAETPESDDIEDLINKTIAVQNSIDNLSTKQVNLSLEIEDDKPIAIGYWGDFHLGAKGTDHRQWKRDVEFISNLNGFYYIGMGDYCNLGLNTHRGEDYDEILNPSQQIQMANWGFEKTSKQALALTRGCHVDRLQQMTDTDLLVDLCKIASCANLWHGGFITLKFNNVDYELRVAHKAPGESSLNTTSAQRKQNEFHGESDIVALAHLHYPDVEQKSFQGRDQFVCLRSGTYKIWDDFAQKLNRLKGIYGIPITILYPKEKKIVPFLDFQTGIKFLMNERA